MTNMATHGKANEQNQHNQNHDIEGPQHRINRKRNQAKRFATTKNNWNVEHEVTLQTQHHEMDLSR